MISTGTQMMMFMASTPSSPKAASPSSRVATGPVMTSRGMMMPRNMNREEPLCFRAVPKGAILSLEMGGM